MCLLLSANLRLWFKMFCFSFLIVRVRCRILFSAWKQRIVKWNLGYNTDLINLLHWYCTCIVHSPKFLEASHVVIRMINYAVFPCYYNLNLCLYCSILSSHHASVYCSCDYSHWLLLNSSDFPTNKDSTPSSPFVMNAVAYSIWFSALHHLDSTHNSQYSTHPIVKTKTNTANKLLLLVIPTNSWCGHGYWERTIIYYFRFVSRAFIQGLAAAILHLTNGFKKSSCYSKLCDSGSGSSNYVLSRHYFL